MTEVYYKEAAKAGSGLAHRVVDALRNLDEARRDYDARGKIRDVADISTRRAKAIAASTAESVRQRPAPYIAGAVGLVAVGVAVALLANPKTRAASAQFVQDLWSKYQSR